MKIHSPGPIIIFLLSIVLCINGCGKNETPTGESEDLSGRITISGAWALYPMVIRWSEEFTRIHPNVQFDISAGGAGKGMADALAGVVDIGMVSREIYPEEMDLGAFWISVTKDAVFLTANDENPFKDSLIQKGLTRHLLKEIYITGQVIQWGDVIGDPDTSEPIHIYTRSDACGAAATWAEFLDNTQEDLLGIGVYGDPGVLEAVIADPLGIGYNNLNFVFHAETGLPITGVMVVPIDLNEDGTITSEEIFRTKEHAVAAVANGTYPSPPARDLNLVTRGKPDRLVKVFLTWVLTDGQAYLDEIGYIQLPEHQLQAELHKLDQ